MRHYFTVKHQINFVYNTLIILRNETLIELFRKYSSHETVRNLKKIRDFCV